MSSTSVIEACNLKRHYHLPSETIKALDGVSFSIQKGELVAITGPSGSGKSTLMNLLGCLDRPSEGSYTLNGNDVSKLSKDALSEVRNQNIGFVFQSFQLLPRLNALENVELPLLYGDWSDSASRAAACLTMVGLENRMSHLPNELSGGQKQRVAIARALVNDPSILLADEPTGNLDTKTGTEILKLLTDLHSEGRTILIVTHDEEVARICTRRIHVLDGLLVEKK